MTKSARIAHAIQQAIAANPHRFEDASSCTFIWIEKRGGPDEVRVEPRFTECVELPRVQVMPAKVGV